MGIAALNRRLPGKTLAALLLAAGLAAGCVPASRVPIQNDTEYSRQPAKRMFAAGYGSIAEKHIQSVAVSEFAYEGIRGLGALDPALTVSRTGGVITLNHREQVQARFPLPADDDVEGWAQVTVDVLVAGRKVSHDLRNASAERIYEAVFDGSLANLDVFSKYAGAEEARRNRAKRDGFGGIGIRFRIRKGAVQITSVIESTPAEIAGIRKGDRIVRINDLSVEGFKTKNVIQKLRGPADSPVTVSVARADVKGLVKFRLKRAHIVSSTVEARYENGALVLKVSSFNQDTARSLGAKIRRLYKANDGRIDGLILDLRGNPGGLLKQSVKVVDLFMSEGTIISTRGRHPESVQYYEAGGHDITHGLPLVVLVDGKSASAAEIVAAALQESGRAVAVGTSSFGKGTVQTVIRLPNEGEITLTWSRLYTPSGIQLHGLGVRPAVCTSGLKAEGKGLETALRDDWEKSRKALSAWSKNSHKDKDARRQLRISCPAERRRDGVELEAARMLLGDPELYAGALDLAAVAVNDNNQKAEIVDP